MAQKQTNGYPWKYCSLGGVVRVNITSGEDIAHLGELDQKLWTVLSCPTKDLAIDERTLQLIDTDGDGKIRVAIAGGPAAYLQAKNHVLTPVYEDTDDYFSVMEFCDMRLARALFDGKVNAVTCVGTGQVRMGGMISQIDNVNRILDRVSMYLA